MDYLPSLNRFFYYPSFFLGMVVEDLTNNASNDIMDIEDEESSPVAAVPNENGNLPVNPTPEKPAFIHQTNGVRIFQF